MKILVLTDIFPSEEEPASGTFVYELSKTVACTNQVVVIHPQLWNPLSMSLFLFKPYRDKYALNRESYKTNTSQKNARENGNQLPSPCPSRQGSGNSPLPWWERVRLRGRSPDEKKIYHSFVNGIAVYRPKLFVLSKGDRLFFRAIFFFLAALPLVKKLRKSFCFDLMHAHMAGPAGFAAVLLGMFFRKPVIITAHGSDIHTFPKHLFLKQLVIFTLKRATKVVAVSQSLKESISKMVGYQKELFVIRNGVNHKEFFPFDKINARERLGLPINKKIILFIGNLLPVKGIDSLLRAFAGMGKKDHIDLIIIGKGESACELKALTKELHIETHISFMGSKKHNEIPVWLNACDVFCLPSRNEGFPTVIVEALACGRPVVATRVGGIPEAIINNTLGILIEPNNIEELAAALNKALEKEWDYQTIAEYGKRFSWDMIAEEYSELYKNVVSKK